MLSFRCKQREQLAGEMHGGAENKNKSGCTERKDGSYEKEQKRNQKL